MQRSSLLGTVHIKQHMSRAELHGSQAALNQKWQLSGGNEDQTAHEQTRAAQQAVQHGVQCSSSLGTKHIEQHLNR